MNIHKGEKPFACEHCDKKFTRLNYLKNHLNTHAKHSSQESQTDFKYDDSSSRQNMDVDSQEDLGAMEAESAAQSIQNEGKSMVENEARGSEGELQTQPVKEQEVFVGALMYIFACSWTESVSKTIKRQKTNKANIQHLHRTCLVNKRFIIWKRTLFSSGTQLVISSG